MSFVWALAVAAALYMAITFVLYRMQDRLIFHPKFSRLVPYNTPKTQLLTLTAPDGVKLEGFWKKSGSKTLLLWFEGNSDNVHQVLPLIEPLGGVDVAALNYRGYGESEGVPGENALFEDAVLLYDTLAKRYSRIILLGRSLGTGVAAFLAAQRPADGLILITPYDSVRALARERFVVFPLGFLVRHPFESVRHLRGNTIATAVLEVIGDRVIPNRRTRALIDSLENPVLYEQIEGCTHGNVESDERFLPFIRKALETFNSGKE
ncbi:MAG: alpha/beta hydrolase [Campylobacterales bacterium]